MVYAVIDISEHANRLLNIVKAKHGLSNKSEAIDLVMNVYEEEVLEPELRPEYVKKLARAGKEKSVKVKNFAKEFKLEG
ncbi:DUF2683 family protein [Candidatus Micrarchaeota archaeon]|nr:DUF2683 family protein [Candidatus Micrarchaeota archaeon]